MNIEEFAAQQKGLRLTLMERLPVKAAETGAKVYTRIGLMQTASARGKALVKELQPILRREANLKINIAHAYGIARCNQVLTDASERVACLERLQQRVAVDLNITLAPDDGIPSGESESNEHAPELRTPVQVL